MKDFLNSLAYNLTGFTVASALVAAGFIQPTLKSAVLVGIFAVIAVLWSGTLPKKEDNNE